MRAEFAAHKARLQDAIAKAEESERRLDTFGKPQSIEEADALKAHLEQALAELEEQRGALEAGDGTVPDPE